MIVNSRWRRPRRSADRHAGVVLLTVAGSFAAVTAAALVHSVPAHAERVGAPEKTTLRVVGLKAPIKFRLDHATAVTVTVANRGKKTVRRLAVRLSVGPLPDPGFKISWTTARSGALKPGASRSFTFQIKISSRFDKDHTKKANGQIVSFYGAGNYVLEACTGPTLTSDDACRESHTIRVT
jgi:hypothetical protein